MIGSLIIVPFLVRIQRCQPLLRGEQPALVMGPASLDREGNLVVVEAHPVGPHLVVEQRGEASDLSLS